MPNSTRNMKPPHGLQFYEWRQHTAGAGHVPLVVYDVTGRRVRTLAAGELAQGLHSTAWDGLDDSGQAVSSGVYFSWLEFDGGSQIGKLVLLK